MKVDVLLFAAAREAAGNAVVSLHLSNTADVAELRARLTSTVPALAPLAASLLVAVNNQYADDNVPLKGDDEIACFPPVSGG
ncbi:MAG: MoaD/ThiS family protein [Fuerstiella sp.]|jgi:molybdopterin converting factor subunit 1|nr:MoaD/ThiS family protein [Fuerstiella sp.]MCP4505916.1 MoaD/ThiS family protein [Fuerstiella sp.]MDG2131001.1 MoaD/ThiS family protein [Fuerstiella sp.]